MGQLGFPIAITLILIYLIVRYVNKKDKMLREDTKEQINLLRKENKEDKKLFELAINSFNVAVCEFKNVQQETNTIKNDMIEVKNDLLIIKTKIESK
ncbi:hypothetical protein [Inconstantimicrobium mannanitabidum]|uniref:Uncharacterized protein n=1 Tax=Inconstantimicrobium mannanitabidum TaxID=1604901 RepID=A0ACB5RA15_9CLOT|nr:hypothetical protein [Clostridium sp. TW13]GKX65848.1 hypothetical protein rsdtw13_11060 [Clostridium sp. TW13]